MKRRATSLRPRNIHLCHERLETRQLLAADPFSPWTHPLDPADSNSDGTVTVRDALVVINQLGRSDTADLAAVAAPPILGLDADDSQATLHLDTNGDSELTVRDALFVINRLGQSTTGIGSAESEEDPSIPVGQEDDAQTLGFDDDFAHVISSLSAEQNLRTYRFTAVQPRATVDLNSVLDESLAELTILDAQMQRIASSSSQAARARFQGIDFPTQPGREYFVRVEFADGASEAAFDFALSVFQFEPSRWLPESSDELTDVDGDDGGDVGDTILTAVDVAIRPNGSSFVQSLEMPGDVDVFRLPNGLPGSVFVQGVDGIGFELLGENGDVLEREPSSIAVNDQTDVGYYRAFQDAALGSDSIYLRVFSNTESIGQYSVSVLLDNTPDQSDQSLLSGYSQDQAGVVHFHGNSATITGATEISGQVHFYRFSATARRAVLTLSGDEGVEMQLFRASDESPIGPPRSDSLSAWLNGPTDQTAAEYVLAIHNPRQSSDYRVAIELIEPTVIPVEVDVADLESAVPLSDSDPSVAGTHSVVTIAANEVKYYSFESPANVIRMLARGLDERDESVLQLQFHLLDQDAEVIPGSYPDNFESILEILDRLGGQIVIGDTHVGQQVFLRIANPTDQAVTFRLSLS
ncbi:dockerin type I domain-containing protein [Rhodopirellula sp. JC639]|uniref:dockerin type I domain-containing protein n=1 Tax=Stieleria mannarensis TaxID=2755585 RepID=UPI00160308D3|nr:dockerin type I domain-containing protein [Rhodopirellula sp. JC639]